MVAEGPAGGGRLLTFRVGEGRFAVLLEHVLGVQDPAEAGAGIGGAVQFQGHPVAAVDARGLGWGGSDAPAASRPSAVIVVSGVGGAQTAMVVDRVEGIVEGVEIRPLPALVAPFLRGAFRGLALLSEGGRLVVDPAALPAAAGKTAAADGRREPGEA